MKFVLEIDCNNEAFDNLKEELERILRHVSDNVACDMILRDINGNVVGHAHLFD